jgi:diaminopimelate decarboxylase
VFGQDDDSVLFYDLDRFQARITELRDAFPVGTLHALAVKANPSIAILEMAAKLGMGVEAASRGELALVEAAGVETASVVFDSPAKTEREIAAALERPLLLNANSRAELLRIAALNGNPRARVGLRVNPTIGAGTIGHTSTATVGSKFGVPISSARSAIAEYCERGGRLDGLHTHVGSQGMSLEQLVRACGAVYDLFVELRCTVPSLRVLDIGGGLPVAYRSDQAAPTHADYAAALKREIPELWSGDLSLVTEFGRSMHANNGWVASRIEYVLKDGAESGGTLITHVGADLFVRTAYQPELWQHEVLAVSSDGDLLGGDTASFNVAGPLCFSGDYVARGVPIPANVAPGDYLIVRDSGAYTASMWSIYNSRQMPKSVGYGAGAGFTSLTRQEPLDSVVARWKA